MKRIDLKELLAIDGGLSYIIHRYPDAQESEHKKSRKFKIRGDERTASAGLKKLQDGTWIVTDFGADSKGKNAVNVCMTEDNVDFVTALNRVAAFYQFDGADVVEAKPTYNAWPARPDEAEGSMTFKYKEFETHEIRVLFKTGAWNALGRDDLARFTAGVALCTYLHLKCLESYTHTINGKTQEIGSTELFPIFLWDEGDFKKLYKPKAEKKFRFQTYGKRPDGLIHGLDQAQKKFGKLQAAADAEAYDPDAEDAEEKRKEKKLPELIRCSGGTDALNVAALGYNVIWPNSETAELTPKDVKEMFRIATAVYNIPDIDSTGIREGHKVAMDFLNIITIWLPADLKRFRDANGNACKDVRDYLSHYRKYDFDELKRVSIPYQFWDEDVSRDKDGKPRVKFGKPMVKYEFNNVHGYNFLFQNGYGRMPSLKEKEGFTFVHVHNNIVKPIDPGKVKDFVHGFLTDRKASTDLRNTMYRTPQLSDSSLANLPLFVGDFKTYGPTYQYMFFQKSSWKVTAEGIEEAKAGKLDKVIWEHKVIQHPAKLMGDMFAINKTAEGAWDIDIKDKSCYFFRFLIQTCRVHWRKELEERLKLCDMDAKARKQYVDQYGFTDEEVAVMLGHETAEKQAQYRKEFQFAVDGGLLLPDEVAEQKLHLINRIFSIGYALHRYKNPAKPWAVFAMDNKLSDDGESHGGAGKGLVAKALYKLATKVQLDGRNPKLSENPHVFENVDADTDLVHVEDSNEYLNFGFFFAPLTSSMTINPKQKRSFELGFEDSPKFWFDTNFGDRMTDPSSLRRKLYTVFGDYYHENNGDYKESWTPNDDFGKSLFTDFTEQDWNCFYNFMAQCLRFYLSVDEKITPPMTNVSKRNLMSEMGDHFRGWAEVFFSPESGNLDNLIVKEDAMKDFEISTKLKTFSSQRFLKALKSWTKFHGYILNPAELLNGQGRIVRRPGGNGTPKEMVYIQTPGKDLNELL